MAEVTARTMPCIIITNLLLFCCSLGGSNAILVQAIKGVDGGNVLWLGTQRAQVNNNPLIGLEFADSLGIRFVREWHRAVLAQKAPKTTAVVLSDDIFEQVLNISIFFEHVVGAHDQRVDTSNRERIERFEVVDKDRQSLVNDGGVDGAERVL